MDGSGYAPDPWEEDPDYYPNSQENPKYPIEDEEYDEYGRSPISFSSADYRQRPPAPRQYQPYSGGQWAGDAQQDWACTGDEVQCGALEECVRSGNLCDGEIDCTNAWDETANCPPRGK